MDIEKRYFRRTISNPDGAKEQQEEKKELADFSLMTAREVVLRGQLVSLESQLAKRDKAIKFLWEKLKKEIPCYLWGIEKRELKHILGNQEFERIVKNG